jgi:hypothetical protein
LDNNSDSNSDKWNFCDECEQNTIVKEYWFDNGESRWSKLWCNECLVKWECANITLKEKLEKLRDEPKLTFWQKIIKKFKRKRKSAKTIGANYGNSIKRN